MLKAMRSGTHSVALKYVLSGFVLLATVGLGLSGNGNPFSSNLRNSAVAKIGSDRITSNEFDNIVQTTLHQQNIPQREAIKAGLPQRILTEEINNRLYHKAAFDMGLIADDKTVALEIKKVLKQVSTKGMSEKEALNNLLRGIGMSEDQFVAGVRQQIGRNNLLRAVGAGATAPEQMVQDALQYRFEGRKAEYFTISSADLGKTVEPSDKDLQAYFKTISGQFMLPEYRKVSVLLLDKKSLGGEASKVSEADLKKYYSEHKDDFGAPEQRLISQVVAEDENTAKTIYEAAQKSKNLKVAADAAVKGKANYIAGQSYTAGTMAVELSAKAFAGKQGEILPPLKSPLGWHVMYVEKVTASNAKPFEDVKAKIEKDLSQDKSASAVYEQANKIDDMVAAGKNLGEIAKQYGLKEVVFDKVDALGIGADKKPVQTKLPVFEKVLKQAFSLQKGETGQMIETPTGEFVLLAVNDIYPAEQIAFEKVRAEVIKSWKEQKSGEGLEARAVAAMDKLKKGATFKQVAQELGKAVSETGFVLRATPAEKAGVESTVVQALFNIEKKGDSSSVAGKDKVTLLHFVDRKVEMPKDASKEDVESVQNLLSRSLQNDILDEYRMSLMAKYDVTINSKLIDETYKVSADDNEDEGR